MCRYTVAFNHDLIGFYKYLNDELYDTFTNNLVAELNDNMWKVFSGITDHFEMLDRHIHIYDDEVFVIVNFTVKKELTALEITLINKVVKDYVELQAVNIANIGLRGRE